MDVSVVEIRVRYAETDRMGRAHHSHHLTWCEAARTAWLRDRGVAYAELEEAGVFLPVSRVEVDYRRPAGYDEIVRVEAWPSRSRSRSVTFRYSITHAGSEEVLAEAETRLICVDADGQVRRLPPTVRETLEAETIS